MVLRTTAWSGQRLIQAGRYMELNRRLRIECWIIHACAMPTVILPVSHGQLLADSTQRAAILSTMSCWFMVFSSSVRGA